MKDLGWKKLSIRVFSERKSIENKVFLNLKCYSPPSDFTQDRCNFASFHFAKSLTSFIPNAQLIFNIVIGTLLTVQTFAQQPQKEFIASEIDTTALAEFGNKKTIPLEIKKQALIALSFYPELKDTKIIFRLRNKNTPLTSRPRIFHVFKGKKNRAYVITISTKENSKYAPILFQNLPFNAQVGVLGHEIAHIAYYKNKSVWQLLGLPFKIMNSKFTDQFEFDTDKATIEHGLGYQLLDWSIYVRKALDIDVWKGADNDNSTTTKERYMNPKTIKQYITKHLIYD